MGFSRESTLAAVLDHTALNQAAASLYRDRFDSTPGVVYAAGVEHAYNLAMEFRAAGLKAEAVSGRTPPVKLAEILAAYDAAPDGEKGALLRREGLYSSHIVAWRRARDASALAGLAVPRGRRRREPQAEQIARLEQEKRQLEQELAKTRFVVEVQAKLHALLETLSESAQPENGSMK